MTVISNLQLCFTFVESFELFGVLKFGLTEFFKIVHHF